MTSSRKQLTLFINSSNDAIENIRAKFNPEQHQLIPAHITLCREEELEDMNVIVERLKTIHLDKPLQINLVEAERFANDKGVFIPATQNSSDFTNLRTLILGSNANAQAQVPHITLMHPRNSTCDDAIFNEIQNEQLPTVLFFDKISSISQENAGKWEIIQEFRIVK